MVALDMKVHGCKQRGQVLLAMHSMGFLNLHGKYNKGSISNSNVEGHCSYRHIPCPDQTICPH